MNIDFFTNNRNNLAKKLPGALIVVPAYTRMQRMADMAHAFDQEANFWYLSGIEEPDWLLIIDGTQDTSWLVEPNIDDAHKIFDGALDVSEASATSGVRKVISTEESDILLRSLAKRHSVVYTTKQSAHADGYGFTLNPSNTLLTRKLERMFKDVRYCNKELATLRAIKQPEEIRAIESAIHITNEALNSVHKNLSTYKYEYEIEADITAVFRRSGAKGHAYDPIVAASKNACTLHYVKNADKLRKRQLVLIDVGARHNGYAADITRTYAYGEPTKRQAEVHARVAMAQRDCIAILKPGLAIREYIETVDQIMSAALRELGLVTDKNQKSARDYFPHAISHGLGIDVHDELGAPMQFAEGMVLTVEPGIYIPEESIGVRIEDDIVITQTGHRNLSGKLSTDL